MSSSCLAFVLLSRASDVSVLISFASVIYGSFIVDALLSLHLLLLFLFFVAGDSMFICFYLIAHADLDYLFTFSPYDPC